MSKLLTILFTYRNREPSRIRHSIRSLEKQTDLNFKVIFVDYGSSEKNSGATQQVLSQFSFVEYHYVAHPGLLWNKGKAFNYGIKKSKSEYIVTADIDLIFHPEFVAAAKRIASPENYTVFSYAYLQKQETEKISNLEFSKLKPSHLGNITGSGLYPKASLEKIHGFDEFYHFYGSEDEDLFVRLEHAGLQRKEEGRNMLVHQWHPRYPFQESNKISFIPKVNNIRRINLEHYNRTKEKRKIIPDNQEIWGECFDREDLLKLQKPKNVFRISCRESAVIHFLHESLPNCNGVTEVNFTNNNEKFNLKKLIKQMLGKKVEPSWSLKEINDEILKMVLFRYRKYNYEYLVHEDLRSLTFRIDFDQKNNL